MQAAPPPLPNVRQYRSRLSRCLSIWRRGLWLCSLLRLATILLLAVVAYAAVDYFLALENGPRSILGGALLTFLVVAIVWEAVSISRLGDRQIARRADTLSGRRRKPVLSALELLEEREQSDGGLRGYLIGRTVHEANDSLGSLPDKFVFPRPEFRRAGLRFVLIGGACLVAALLLWPAVSVLFGRIAFPWRDIPPYSPLRFAVDPATPEIFYGDDATVTVEITGGELREPVRFLTRDGDEVFETVCFQDGPNRFAQKLERVVRPTEFAFAHGRARSEWHTIDLLLEPKVALASVTVTPPEYASLPQRTFLIGEEPLAALRGSKIKLSVTSNRPPVDGELSLHPVGQPESEGMGVEGKKTAGQTVTFEWTAEHEAELDIEIRDVRGTPNRDPLRIAQRLIPDKPPEIDMVEPPVHLMATPSISVPVEVRAEDDFGLGRLDFVRTVVGYRDRLENITPPSSERRVDFQSRLDLSKLGVRPGETIELYFQAADRNPSLLGINASEVSRVQIISDEEYANIIRSRTTVQEFADRFNVVNEALSSLRQSMEELKEAMESGDEAKIAETRAQAEQAAGEAAQLFELLSGDFAAFDLESSAIENAAATLEELQSISSQLQQSGDDLSPEQLAAMMEKLGMREEGYREQQEAAQEVAAVSRVMEMAAEFSRIARDQDTLTRRLKQFETQTRANDVPFLEALGSDQEALRESLENFSEELENRIGELPPDYQELADSARAFLGELKKAGPESDMKTSTEASGNEDGARSYEYSSLALEKLNELMNQGGNCESFCELTQGRMTFQVPASLESTLSQMLAAIGLRGGGGFQPGGMPGGAGGGGMGLGGNSDDGYSMAGYTALDIPVVGPPRMRLQYSANPQTGNDNSGAPGGEGPGMNDVTESEHFSGTSAEAPGTSPADFDRVPEKYRDAVKRYFTYEENRNEKKNDE